jgi:hypothetical protein
MRLLIAITTATLITVLNTTAATAMTHPWYPVFIVWLETGR